MTAATNLRPPSLQRAALEWLSLYELSAFHAASPLFSFVKTGDGHPVLVLPGFVGSDRSTAPLRRLLRLRGHDAHGWLLGPNYGAHERVMSGMYRRLEQLHERTGERGQHRRLEPRWHVRRASSPASDRPSCVR